MARDLRVVFPASTLSSGLLWVGRALLLVPEAVLIAALLCCYLALGGPPLLAGLTALLMVSFLARVAALYLARAALERANYSAAEALIQVALALYPWSADALALRGALALASNAPEVAEASFRRAIALCPGQSAFHAALSCALLDLGRPGEAAAAARLALALDNRATLAYLYLAEAGRTLGTSGQLVEDQLRAGLAVAQDAATTATLECALASHLLSESRVAEATLALQRAEALLPRCPAPRQAEVRFHLGELLIVQGQVERAREHFYGVESLDPQGRYAAAAWRAARVEA